MPSSHHFTDPQPRAGHACLLVVEVKNPPGESQDFVQCQQPQALF